MKLDVVQDCVTMVGILGLILGPKEAKAKHIAHPCRTDLLKNKNSWSCTNFVQSVSIICKWILLSQVDPLSFTVRTVLVIKHLQNNVIFVAKGGTGWSGKT